MSEADSLRLVLAPDGAARVPAGPAQPAASSAEEWPRPGEARILVPGRTCWRIARAERVALVVDAAAYFAVLASAIERARRSILMLGWDFHSRVRLRREASTSDELAARLDAAARRRRGLRVRVLGWDWAMIYALERELLPRLRFDRATHPRVRFRLDGAHPLGACHHQKVVVIDDALAFVGGIDVTMRRWDTREHRIGDPRRVDPSGDAYGPFHDVQMAVDGEAARALGDLARERWRRATGRRLRPVAAPPPGAPDPWPPELAPQLRGVEVGIARTLSPLDGDPVREVEALFLAALRAARRTIYIENQYFTARSVGAVLAQRLGERDGPEVVVVGPRHCYGWLEEGSMGVLRARLVRRLRDADRYGRLRVYAPLLPGGGDPDAGLKVHSKVLIVDDAFLRVGSANVSNRSLGLDSECDLALEARDAAQRRLVEAFRNDLVAEHLGCDAAGLGRSVAECGSLRAAIDAVRARRPGGRTLEPLEIEVPEWLEEIVPERGVGDPERPATLDRFAAAVARDEELASGSDHRLIRHAIWALALVGLALAWRFTPLAEWLEPGRVASLAAPLRADPLGPLWAGAAFVVAGLALAPVTALIVACSLVFGWVEGFATALASSLICAAVGWALGRFLWRDLVRRAARGRVDRLSRKLARHGALAVAAIRLVPIAPFGIVNLAAGSSRIRLRDFLLGTLLGMGPGTLALSLFSDSVLRALSEPSLGRAAAAVAAGTFLVLLTLWLRRRFEPSRHRDREADGPGHRAPE